MRLSPARAPRMIWIVGGIVVGIVLGIGIPYLCLMYGGDSVVSW